MENPTFATRWNIDEIDSNYQRWLEDRSSVESKWQYFFEGFHLANDGQESPPVRSSSVETGNKQSIETHARLYGAIYCRSGISGIRRRLLILFVIRLRKTPDFPSKGLVLNR